MHHVNGVVLINAITVPNVGILVQVPLSLDSEWS